MGIGGIVLVAACVMFECKDTSAKVVPADHHLTDTSVILSEYLLDGQILTMDTPTTHFGNYLTIPNSSPFFPTRKASIVSIMLERRQSSVCPPTSEPPSPLQAPNGPGLYLPLLTKSTPFPICLSSHQVEDEFVPSPQDIDLPDPDGCETPLHCSLDSIDIELYNSDSCLTVMAQVEPNHLASIESDGISDSASSEAERQTSAEFDKDGINEPLLHNKPCFFKTFEFPLSTAKPTLSGVSNQDSLSNKLISSHESSKDSPHSNEPKTFKSSEINFLGFKNKSYTNLKFLQKASSTDSKDYVLSNKEGTLSPIEKPLQHTEPKLIHNSSVEMKSLAILESEDEEEMKDDNGEQSPLLKDNKEDDIPTTSPNSKICKANEMINVEENSPTQINIFSSVSGCNPPSAGRVLQIGRGSNPPSAGRILQMRRGCNPPSAGRVVQMGRGCNPQQQVIGCNPPQQVTGVKENAIIPVVSVVDSSTGKLVNYSFANGKKCGIYS
ncbi:uncharacterized protein LOC143243157 [Tachypleus tridentatus]|uniref:uncharacterized protein LOC143243157 n=1 Tax=Tachypleus tridentatus TaxID=6853 RepID=UPI003FD3C147